MSTQIDLYINNLIFIDSGNLFTMNPDEIKDKHMLLRKFMFKFSLVFFGLATDTSKIRV